MRVLFLTAEAEPFAKVGGLGDVAGSLPGALVQHSVDCRVMLPLYGTIDRERHNITPLWDFTFTRRTGPVQIRLHSTQHGGVTVYLLEAPPYFGQEAGVYGPWDSDITRFVLFNQVALAAAWELGQREGWFPDVVHANDWHTGLVPFFLALSRFNPGWEHVTSVITLHNVAHQGGNVGGWLFEQGLPARDHPALQPPLTDNMLAIGVAYADLVTTVSPRHASEIQYPAYGYGLDPLIRSRVYDLHGVLNGIDTHTFDPGTDPALAYPFDVDTFAVQRPLNKAQLQLDAGLPVRADVMLVGLVSRVTWQKGFDIALPALRQWLSEADAQFVMVGSGEPAYVDGLRALARDFPDKAHVVVGYDAFFAQRIYGGCDVFLMPSHYEPCGIGQMIAMRYGALPLVRETGGLADTVENYDDGPADGGTGFVFDRADAWALLNTLRWAQYTYDHRPGPWARMQARAMQRDLSWARSARLYAELYERLARRRTTV